MLSRLSLRLRLALVFAIALALVLTALGSFVYVRLGASLLEQIDASLVARADALASALASEPTNATLPGAEEEFAQVLAGNGDVVAASPGFDVRLLPARALAESRRAPFLTEVSVSVPGEDDLEPARLFVRPLGERRVVVGASLEDRADALEGLLFQLLVGAPIALLLVATGAYVLAGAALRPVAAMRRRAAEISAETSAERLPLPTARDEVYRLGTTLNEMLDRLDAGLRRERRFVADASHELRTPLALLRAELDLALRRPRTREELESALRSASDEVDRLTMLAEGLLLLASTDEGTVPLHAERFAARDLLETVARRFMARDGPSRTIEVDTGPDVEITADRLRLEQALGNLVDNALHHGGGPVRLTARVEGGSVLLRVTDEGAGFPPAFLSRAFDRFSRADMARTRRGSGLGLAIVAAVARAHGGEALAENAPGGGAVLTIVLPIVPASRTPATVPRP